MSTNPTPAAPAVADNTKPDQTLRLRQVMVWLISVVLAVLTAIFLLQIGVPAIWPNNGRIPLDSTVPISFLNLPLLPLVALPLIFFFLIWVDYFFRAKVVND